MQARSILAGLVLTLACCGGGPGNTSAPSPAGVPDLAAPTANSSADGSSLASVSASGTMLPCATEIVDSSGTIWTLMNGQVYEQLQGSSSMPAGVSANVVLVLYYDGVIYQENDEDKWWSWSGTAWVLSESPDPSATLACPSDDGGTVSNVDAGTLPTSGFGIKVVGNTFTDLSGKVLQLQGENVTSLEITDTSMWDAYYATSPATWKSIASAWHLNIIRLPLNEWSWRTNPSSAKGTAYQKIVETAVANITAAGMYVILDLHWAAPDGYNGGKADGQPGYLDANNATSFWSSMATTFKSNPAVLFELFNEPYGDDDSSPWDATRLGLLLNGGTAIFWDQANGKGGPSNTGVSFQVVGHQQLVTAIRATGATNVILYSCPIWDNEPSQSLAVKPTDPLGQLAATVHYAGGSNADYTSILDANTPILMTEFYTLAGRGGYSWAQSNHIGYVMWGANNWSSAADLSFLITSSPWSYNSASVAWPPF